MSDPELHGLHVRIRQDAPVPLDAELNCAPGELLALVGPSGSGKTSILRAIAGLLRPEHGEIVCNRVPWHDTVQGLFVPPQKRRVGFVFQAYALFPHLSALQNVTSALGHLPRGRRVQRASELLQLVRLAGLESRHPGHLSGGQQQRVALARALAREPTVLLLDEPFSAVDRVTRRKLQGELVLLRRRINIPIVLVTHDLEEATAVADRISAVHRGEVLQDGPPTEVMTRPCSALVARLMDLANIFDGTVVKQLPARGITLLRWRRYVIEVRHTDRFSPGAKVSWVVPPDFIVMHRRHRPSRGERENPVRGTVGDLMLLGEKTVVRMFVDGDEEAPLTFHVSTHVATRNELTVGEPLTVSLLTEGIHLMPPIPGGREAANL